MKLPQFFISRPIFAGVLSSLILLAGLLALPQLPISEYPEVVPPTVVVRANFPGANPKVIAETVASPLEQAINGVEDMLYQSSQSTADGVMSLTVTFALGTDVDKAQVQVQNRVAQALPKLPEVVQRLGVTTNKASPDLTMVVHLVSQDDRYDTLYLANYSLLRVKDDKDYAVTGTKDHLWIEAEMAKELGDQLEIDMSYFEKLEKEAHDAIDYFGSFAQFVQSRWE